jgi:hypothetical protein
MSDSRVYLTGSGVQLAKNIDPARDQAALDPVKESRAEERPPQPETEPQYLATSPNGTKLTIPKELFVALADFMKTRKCPGSITIQFRRGEIICVEAVAKKTYRGH